MVTEVHRERSFVLPDRVSKMAESNCDVKLHLKQTRNVEYSSRNANRLFAT